MAHVPLFLGSHLTLVKDGPDRILATARISGLGLIALVSLFEVLAALLAYFLRKTTRF